MLAELNEVASAAAPGSTRFAFFGLLGVDEYAARLLLYCIRNRIYLLN